MKSLPMLYCDMDGVLADFKKAAEKITGLPLTQWQNTTKSENVDFCLYKNTFTFYIFLSSRNMYKYTSFMYIYIRH